MSMNYFQAANDRVGQTKVHKTKISTIKRSSRQPSALRSVILGVLVFPLLLLSPARSFSQQGPAARPAQPEESTIRDAQKTTLAPDALVIQRRAPIPFKPFEMVDPDTMKPIKPSDVINLPDGKKTTAEEFYKQLNSFEQWLNTQGHSMRTNESKIELARVPVDESLLLRQRQESTQPTALPTRPNFVQENIYSPQSVQRIQFDPNKAAGDSARTMSSAGNDAIAKVNALNLTGRMRDDLVIDPASLASIGKLGLATSPSSLKAPPCVSVNKSRNWAWNQGTASKFDTYVNGTIALTGQACKPANMQNFNQNNSQFTASALGVAGGHVFNHGGDVLRLTANITGNQAQNTVSANVQAFVLGKSIYSLNRNASAHWGINDKVSRGTDVSTSFRIQLGPVPIDLTVGFQGSLGLSYSLDLYPSNVNVAVTPFVHTNVYAEASVNLWIAKAGVGVSMTLLNLDMELGASTGIGWSSGFYVSANAYAKSSMDMLRGKLYLFLKTHTLWADHEWDTTLWSWNGMQYNSVLFNENLVIPLHW